MDPTGLRTDLLKAVTFNVAIGNGDAHSKNYALLISERGEVSLAPLYDTAPVAYLDPRFKGTGHVINGQTSIDWVSTEDLIAEAGTWGLPRRQSEKAVVSTMERVRAVIDSTTMPVGTHYAKERLEAMWTRRSWPVPSGAPSSTDDNAPNSPAEAPNRCCQLCARAQWLCQLGSAPV